VDPDRGTYSFEIRRPEGTRLVKRGGHQAIKRCVTGRGSFLAVVEKNWGRGRGVCCLKTYAASKEREHRKVLNQRREKGNAKKWKPKSVRLPKAARERIDLGDVRKNFRGRGGVLLFRISKAGKNATLDPD